MPSFSVDATVVVDFEVFCAKCGAGLCRYSATGTTSGRGQNYVSVEPCDTCLENARNEGYNDGVNENGNP